MRKNTKTLAAALTMLLPMAAQADISVSAVGLLNFANQSVSPSLPSNQSLALGTTVGFGALGGMSIFPGFSLELGALYVPRKISTNDAGGTNLQTITGKTIQVPLLLRFTALPLISVGAGPYYSHTTGSLSVSTPALADQSVEYSTAQVAQSDFGVEASLAVGIPILPTISATGDLRYVLGLTNLDSSGATTQHTRDFQFLAGIKFSL